ncbi:hypothetical protein STEG23_009411, partial [Scotinomys teguina]
EYSKGHKRKSKRTTPKPAQESGASKIRMLHFSKAFLLGPVTEKDWDTGEGSQSRSYGQANVRQRMGRGTLLKGD